MFLQARLLSCCRRFQLQWYVPIYSELLLAETIISFVYYNYLRQTLTSVKLMEVVVSTTVATPWGHLSVFANKATVSLVMDFNAMVKFPKIFM